MAGSSPAKAMGEWLRMGAFGRRFAWALLFILCLAALPALAYDAEAGRHKADELCAPCHGKEGLSELPTVPSLAGQKNDYVVLALYQFRIGHRPSEVMDPQAKPLIDDDLGNLAAYYSALKPWQPVREASAAALASGPALALKNHCIQCHGPQLAGQDSIPRIAGQKIDYFTEQLKAFHAGNRGDIDGNMTSIAAGLSDADIATLADYVSGLKAP
jgi:cytochrome c553